MLNKYLDAIERGDSVNIRSFLKYLPDAYCDNQREFFTLTKDGVGVNYFVAFKKSETLSELRDIATKRKVGGRLGATELGNSHKCKVSSNGFAMRSLKYDVYSLVVVNNNSQSFLPDIAVNKKCVIIENREVFYSDDLAALLLEHGIDGTEYDVILGNGGEVRNTFLAGYLERRYGEVQCLFDYDLAGIQMYGSLVSSISNKDVSITFALPKNPDLYKRPSDSKKPKSSDFHKALKLALELNLIELHADLLKTSRFMEQEMLLVNMKELNNE